MPARGSKKRHHGGDAEDYVSRKVTGKELGDLDEISARLTTLVEMLDQKGVIDKKEYGRTVAMRLHEISKAGAIGDLEEEL